MIYCAGIDGGQSSTKAVIIDEAGTILGRAAAGPLDHIDSLHALETVRTTVRTALDAALAASGLDTATPLAAVVAGLTGFGGAEKAVEQVINAAHVRVTHDAPIALAGALDLAPGVVAIAGTGSVVYAQDALGKSVTVGGWGFLFGDQGSAFWIARQAIERAMLAQDAGEPAHRLGLAAISYFDVPSLHVLARDFYRRAISRERLAGFARLINDAARFGEADALAIFEEGAAHLAACCASAVARLALDEPRIAPVGGAFASGELRARFGTAIERLLPSAVLVEPVHEPVVGAALLALREAKRTPRAQAPS